MPEVNDDDLYEARRAVRDMVANDPELQASQREAIASITHLIETLIAGEPSRADELWQQWEALVAIILDDPDHPRSLANAGRA